MLGFRFRGVLFGRFVNRRSPYFLGIAALAKSFQARWRDGKRVARHHGLPKDIGLRLSINT